MKKYFWLVAIIVIIAGGCNNNMDNNSNEKTQTVIGQSIESLMKPTEGVEKLTDDLSGKSFEAKYEKDGEIKRWFKIKFSPDTNECQIFEKYDGVDFYRLEQVCKRTIDSDGIELDFSPYFKWVDNFTLDVYCAWTVDFYTKYKDFWTHIYNTTTDPTLKAEAENEINSPTYTQLINGHSSVEKYLSLDTNRELYNGVKAMFVDEAKGIKTKNPYKGTIDSENKQITFESWFYDFENKKINGEKVPDYEKPIYIENLVFTEITE